jgi:hypothetical protein
MFSLELADWEQRPDLLELDWYLSRSLRLWLSAMNVKSPFTSLDIAEIVLPTDPEWVQTSTTAESEDIPHVPLSCIPTCATMSGKVNLS